MKFVKPWRLAPLSLAALAVAAQAQQSGESMFSFSGFATIGLVGTNSNDADFVISGQPRGATKSVSGDVDTKLGLQATAKFNQMFSATAQLLTKQNGDGNYKPELEWAFGKAQISPSLAVRVGRMGGPFFAVSDFRDAGYANTWLRPPQDVYGQVPVSHFDGADVSYQMPVGSATLTAQLFGGKSDSKFEGVKVDMKSLAGINLTAELDNGLSLRFGHVQGKLTVHSESLAQLVGVLRATPFASVGDQLDATSKKASFTGIGASWDQNDWLVMTEYTKRKTESYVPDTTGWYVTLGHRFGKFTPYVTLSQLKEDDSNVVNTIPAGVSPQLNVLKATVDGTVQAQSNRQKTTAIGLRWDAYRNIAVKTQFERIKPDGPGLFANPQPGFGAGGNVNVYSVAVDLVF
ncbi:hypothetical protein RQP53_18105 [Paucibacter sp. APW11]|uniref:Porin domain-containing protein n=1 Tax=Roseateles aquae TaxID=3077235 RepID=A0ABU3PFT5_9BURK|nr:hypothetical protein [Paucibacter sp. APW11]MDT9001197.1 hypothetical protein [Paucibacter sp. APW11]